MFTRTNLFSIALLAQLATVHGVFAQGRHGAPAPAPRPQATAHDVIRAYGLAPSAGFNSGAPLTPRFSSFPSNVGANTGAMPYFQLNGAPNTFFPSQTTGFSTAPLFPYSSSTFPYGYGYTARDNEDVEPHYPRPGQNFDLTPDPTSATMKVRVPADAEIWFQGVKTGQRGDQRTFVSPPLESGRGFTYEVKARWSENGKAVEQTRPVHVHAGEQVSIDFVAKK